LGLIEPEIDPNRNFDAALDAARRRQAERSAPDPQRDDLGEPTEPAGTGSRRPLAEQIAEEQGGQPRDPATGQFVSPDDPLQRFGSSPTTHQVPDPTTIEPEPEPEPETAEERQERLLAGRFGSTEELERAYTELEQQQGQSSAEMGTLRATVEDLQRRMYAASVPSPAPAAMTPLSQEQLETGLTRNGREFLANLYEAEHPSYEDALDVALAVNPRLAVQWTSEVTAWEAEQRLRAELEARDQHLMSLSSTVTSARGANVFQDAWREVAADQPEASMLAPVMMRDLEENPWLAAPMKEGVPDAEKKVIQNLLSRARDANRDTVDEARRSQAEELGREKMAATVASGSGTAAPVPGKSAAGGEAAERINRLKASILRDTQGHNVHEAIHGPQT
jgi:hypothetical protein